MYWLGCRLNDRGIGVRFPTGNNSLFWSVQQWLNGNLPPELKSPRLEAYNSTLSRAEFKNACRCCLTTLLRLHSEVLNLSMRTALFHNKYREPLIIQAIHTELIAYFSTMCMIWSLIKLWRKMIFYFKNVFLIKVRTYVRTRLRYINIEFQYLRWKDKGRNVVVVFVLRNYLLTMLKVCIEWFNLTVHNYFCFKVN